MANSKSEHDGYHGPCGSLCYYDRSRSCRLPYYLYEIIKSSCVQSHLCTSSERSRFWLSATYDRSRLHGCLTHASYLRLHEVEPSLTLSFSMFSLKSLRRGCTQAMHYCSCVCLCQSGSLWNFHLYTFAAKASGPLLDSYRSYQHYTIDSLPSYCLQAWHSSDWHDLASILLSFVAPTMSLVCLYLLQAF